MNNEQQNEKDYYASLIRYDTVKNILERRGEKTSCVHDIARIYVPHGKIPYYITSIVSERILHLRRKGFVKLLRSERCDDLNRPHHVYRIRLKHEKADKLKRKYTRPYKKRKKTFITHVKKETVKKLENKNDNVMREVLNSNLTDSTKIRVLKKIL